MKKQIKKIVNNQRGSALAFVLIVGMVLTILLGSLMVLANRGIIFTQESVESRQAYADAKSVIEFGKIYINQDIAKKFKSVDIYKPGGKDTPQGETSDNIVGDEIFYIIGNRKDPDNPDNPDNPLNPLNLSVVEKLEELPKDGSTVLGECNFSWKKTATSGTQVGTPEEQYSASTEYTYKIITKNMRRKMDFKTTFMYIVEKVSKGMALEPYGDGFLIEDNKYIIEKDPEIIESIASVIPEAIGGKYDMDLKLKSYKRDSKSDLKIKGKNISGSSKVYNEAENKVDIEATKTVYFRGDLIFQEKKDKNKVPTTIITGDNVVIKGNLNLIAGAKVVINANRLWINGDINLGDNSELEINATGENATGEVVINEGKRSEGTNNFGKNSTFTLNGKKVWIYGSIIGKTANINLTAANNLVITKIESTDCNLKITADLLKISKKLEIKVKPEGKKTLIKANTFVCAVDGDVKNGGIKFLRESESDSGTFNDKENAPIVIGAKTENKLDLWFQGNYEQKVPVTISEGSQVAFGKDYHSTFNIAAANSNLTIDSKEISFYSNIEQKLSNVSYQNLLDNKITLNLRFPIKAGEIEIVKAGQYKDILGGLNFIGLGESKVPCPAISETIPFKIPEEAGTDYKPEGVSEETGSVEEVTTEYYLPEAEKSTP